MYAVVDTETTGLSPNLRHRVAEIAVVLVDADGRVEQQWCTLVNPDRDLGPQHIHGIRAADVLDAPSFSDVAGPLLAMLTGRTLVAHNLPFDLTFLDAEYGRLGVPFPLTRDLGLCTMTLAPIFLPGAGRSLRECCSAAQVSLTGWHSAMSDARATAGLLRHYITVAARPLPWADVLARTEDVLWPSLEAGPVVARPRTSTLTQPHEGASSLLTRLVDFMPRVDSSELADPYLAVLDQALADRYLSADENAALAALATNLGLSNVEAARLHRDYLNALARVALADQHVSEEESADLYRVGEILGLPEGAVGAALEQAAVSGRPVAADQLPIQPGDMVVFTGDMSEPRELWMQRAVEHGFVPHPAVTKKVRLVVAADLDSLSGKAKKARGYGIPIMGIDDFRIALGYEPPQARSCRSAANRSTDERQWAKILRND